MQNTMIQNYIRCLLILGLTSCNSKAKIGVVTNINSTSSKSKSGAFSDSEKIYSSNSKPTVSWALDSEYKEYTSSLSSSSPDPKIKGTTEPSYLFADSLADGEYEIFTWKRKKDGASWEAHDKFVLVIDTTPPSAVSFSVGTSDFKVMFPETVASTHTNFKEFRYHLATSAVDPSCNSGSVLSSAPFTVNIPAGTDQVLKIIACDHAGNFSGIATATYTYDATAPMATWTSPSPAASQTGPAAYSLVFSDARAMTSSAAGVAAKLTWTLVSGSNPGGSLSVTGTHPSYTITASGFSGDAVMKIALDTGAVTDAAGNTNIATSSGNYVVYSSAPAPTVTASKDFNAGFNASISGASTILGAAFATYRYTTDGSTPNCTTVGTSSASEPTVVAIPAATTTLKAITCTVAGDASTVATSIYTYDTTPPTVSVSAPSVNYVNNSATANFTVTYNDASNYTISSSGITVNGSGGASATVASVTPGPAGVYTVSLNNFTGNGTVGITVNAGTATDAAENSSSASSASATTTVDNIAPGTPSITPSSADYNGNKALSLAQNASPDTNFKHFRVTTTGTAPASCSDGAASGTSYTASGSANMSVKIIACDEAGNFSASHATSTLTYDSTPPTISISGPSAAYAKSTSTITYTVTYSGADTITLASGDITLNKTSTADASKAVSCSGSTCTVTLTNLTGGGTVGISIASATASDAAGNPAPSAGPSSTVAVDNTAPTLSIGAPSSSTAISSSTITYTVTYSDADTITLVDSNITLNTTSTASASKSVSCSGSTCTVTLTSFSGSGTVGISIASATASDNAGNNAAAAGPSTTFTVDGAPTNNGALNITWNGSAATIQWLPATDTITAQSALQYKVVYSTSDSISTVAGANAGTTITDWTTNISSAVASGLTAGNTYYFNVIVKDEAANEAVYTSTQRILEFSSPFMTSSSPERKTFFDSGSNKHWAFWYSGQDVRYGYSADGTSYTQSSTLTAITSPRFTVSSKNGTILIAYESNYDIAVRRGSISGTSITWETAVTALDGSSASDAYSRPAMTIGNDDHLYIAGFQYSSGDSITKATLSVGVYSDTLTWGAALTVGSSSKLLTGVVLVPQGSYAMIVTNGFDSAVQSFAYDGTSWIQKTGSATDWWSFTGTNGTNGTVRALAVLGSDLYVAGAFTAVSGVSAKYIAKWNGSAWSSLGSGLSSTVYALAVAGSDLYVAGDFSTAGGNSASYVAKWNGSTWSALGSGVNNTVYTLATLGSDIYVGGSFTTAGGSSASRIAKWNGSAWSTLGSGVSSTVWALAVSGVDIYAGGQFTTAGGSSANRVAKWSGSAWSALGSGVNATVYALAVSGTDLYVGGSFSTAGGSSASYIAKWSGSTWSALGSGLGNLVYALAVSGTDVYAGGNFSAAGVGSANNIAKWNGSAWSALGSGSNSPVYALAVSGADIYVGGQFSTAGGNSINRIAKWSNSTWSKLGSGGASVVQTLAVLGSDLYVGGFFSTAGGVSANNIAKWNGSAWSALGSGVNGTVYAIAVSGSDIYVGGSFTTAGGSSISKISKWDGSSWSALSSGANGVVYALAVSGSDLYAGGQFTTAGGSSVNYIAKWDGSAWSALGSGLNQYAYALAISGSNLYVGGYFTTAGGSSANHIAKWDGSAWSALGSGVDDYVFALVISGSDLYAGGSFSTAGGSSADYIAKWNGSAWSALGSGVNATVRALAISGSDLYVGGQFTTAGGNTANGVAKWDGSAWSALGSGVNATIRALMVGTNSYAGGDYFLSQYSTNLVARASDFSATYNTSGVQLAYINSSDKLPYYMTYNGTSWSSATSLGTNPVYGSIALSTSSDSSQWLVAWERNGQIEYRKYSSSSWGAVTTAASTYVNRFPSLPELLNTSIIPIVWTKGLSEPFTLDSSAISFP